MSEHAEKRHGHAEIASLARLEQERGRINWTRVYGYLDGLSNVIAKKINYALLGDETKFLTNADLKRDDVRVWLYYLFSLYISDVQSSIDMFQKMSEAEQRNRVQAVTGNSDGPIDIASPAHRAELLEHFKLDREGSFAKAFLGMYEDFFAAQKPKEAEPEPMPTAAEIFSALDACGAQNATQKDFERLEALLVKLDKAAAYYGVEVGALQLITKIKTAVANVYVGDFVREQESLIEELEQARQALGEAKMDADKKKILFERAREDFERKKKIELTPLEQARDGAKEKTQKLYTALKDAEARLESLKQDLRSAEGILAKATNPAPQATAELQESVKTIKTAVANMENNIVEPARRAYETASGELDKTTDEIHNKNRGLEAGQEKKNMDTAENEYIDAQRETADAQTAVTQKEHELNALRTATIGKEAREFNLIHRADLDKEVENLGQQIEKKKKAMEKVLPGGQSGATLVYMCMRKEHAALIPDEETAHKNAARDLARFAVLVKSDAFKDAIEEPTGCCSKTISAAFGVVDFNEGRHLSAKAVLEDIPFLRDIKLDADPCTLKRHFEKIDLPVLIDLAVYLQRQGSSQREKERLSVLLKYGIQAGDLVKLRKFTFEIENIIAERLGEKLASIEKAQALQKIPGELQTHFYRPREHARSLEFAKLEKAVKAVPAPKREHTEGGAIETAKEALSVMSAIGGISEFVEEAAKLFRRKK